MADDTDIENDPFFQSAAPKADGDDTEQLLNDPFFQKKPGTESSSPVRVPTARLAAPSPPSDAFATEAKMTLPQKLYAGASNIIPSTGRLAAGLYENVRHLPKTLSTTYDLGKGVLAYTDQLAGEGPADQNDKNVQLVNALVSSYKNKYGSWQGVQHALITDPASVALDLSALLTGGETAIAPVAGAIGKVGALGDVSKALELAGKASGAVGRAVNPLNPLGVVSKVAPPVTKTMGRAGILPKVDNVIQDTFNGRLGAKNFTGDAAPIFAKTVGAKGLTKPAIREATLKAAGAPNATETMTTGISPPTELRPRHDQSVAENNLAFGKKANEIAGAPSPSGSNIVGQIEQAQIAAQNNTVANYARLNAHPGIFAPSLGGITLKDAIETELKKGGTSINSVLAHPTYPQAQKALEYLKEVMPGTTSGTPRPLSMSELNEIRKGINSFANNADGTDIAAIRAIRTAFDQNMINGAKAGLYNGQDAAAVVNDMTKAIGDYKDYMDTFKNPNGLNKPIYGITKKLVPEQEYDAAGNLVPSADAGVHQAIQKDISKLLMEPSQGPALYDKLKGIVGNGTAGEKAIHDFIRQEILKTDNGGVLVHTPDEIDEFLNAPNGIASKVFDPNEENQLRLMSEARRITNGKTSKGNRSDGISKAAAHATGSLALKYAAAKAGETVGGLPGSLVGLAGESAAENFFSKLKSKQAETREMAGAPVQGKLRRTIAPLVNRMTSPMSGETAQQIAQAKNIEAGNPQPPSSGAQGAAPSETEFAGLLQRIAPGARISSGQRTPEKNASLVGSAPNSMHLSGKAADVVLPPGMSEDEFRKRLVAEGFPVTEFLGADYAIAHGERPHVHVGWASKAASGGRIGRARGGRVMDHEAEADRLIGAAEKAKKNHAAATKPLLNVPDEAVTHALSIANESI